MLTTMIQGTALWMGLKGRQFHWRKTLVKSAMLEVDSLSWWLWPLKILLKGKTSWRLLIKTVSGNVIQLVAICHPKLIVSERVFTCPNWTHQHQRSGGTRLHFMWILNGTLPGYGSRKGVKPAEWFSTLFESSPGLCKKLWELHLWQLVLCIVVGLFLQMILQKPVCVASQTSFVEPGTCESFARIRERFGKLFWDYVHYTGIVCCLIGKTFSTIQPLSLFKITSW